VAERVGKEQLSFLNYSQLKKYQFKNFFKKKQKLRLEIFLKLDIFHFKGIGIKLEL